MLMVLEMLMSKSWTTICSPISLMLLILILFCYPATRVKQQSFLMRVLLRPVSRRASSVFFIFPSEYVTSIGTICKYTALVVCAKILTAPFGTLGWRWLTSTSLRWNESYNVKWFFFKSLAWSNCWVSFRNLFDGHSSKNLRSYSTFCSF